MHIFLLIPYLGISQESLLTIYVRRVIESNLIARNFNYVIAGVTEQLLWANQLLAYSRYKAS